jgi:hypothetical protein
MNCPNCSNACKETAKFCEECGTRLMAVCGSCGTELSLSVKFCGECGTATHAGGSGATTQEVASTYGSPEPARRREQGAERRQLTVMF